MTDQISLDLQKSLNLNLASYFISTLASPHAYTWHHIGGPVTHTIDNFCPFPNHERSMEHTQKTVISYIEQVVKYTRINVSKNHGRTYLLSYFYEVYLLANPMPECIGIRYTTLLINCHRETHGNNAVSRSTVNLAFRILQPKITRIQKMKQGTKNEGKWKEARYPQVKQWFIIPNIFREEKK